MNYQLVPIADSGPLTFACCKCGIRVQQDQHNDGEPRNGYKHGPVWADTDGPSWVYWCQPCKRAEVMRRVA